MSKIIIGILKEGKIPVDERVAITPQQCVRVEKIFPELKIIVQKSPVRCCSELEYANEQIEMADNMLECDILLGIKEVPVIEFIENTAYLFFSHTTKEQPYNRVLIREILRKKIRLIDYECLTDTSGARVIAFGLYAGIVGAYNGILIYGLRYKLFKLRRAYECDGLEDLKNEYNKVALPPVKIAITGGGRVAKGAMEVLDGMGIKNVFPEEYLSMTYDIPVYTQFRSKYYNKNRNGKPFDRQEFHEHPERFESDFYKFARNTDLLIAAAYWDPDAPVLFTREDILKLDFRIKVVADITCDIEGSIPSTKKASTIDDPVYDYNPKTDTVEKPMSDESNITMMAVDNLPCELPKDSSNNFGEQLIANVLPSLLRTDDQGIIARGTITKNGSLTQEFAYLQDYVDGK